MKTRYKVLAVSIFLSIFGFLGAIPVGAAPEDYLGPLTWTQNDYPPGFDQACQSFITQELYAKNGVQAGSEIPAVVPGDTLEMILHLRLPENPGRQMIFNHCSFGLAMYDHPDNRDLRPHPDSTVLVSDTSPTGTSTIIYTIRIPEFTCGFQVDSFSGYVIPDFDQNDDGVSDRRYGPRLLSAYNYERPGTCPLSTTTTSTTVETTTSTSTPTSTSTSSTTTPTSTSTSTSTTTTEQETTSTTSGSTTSTSVSGETTSTSTLTSDPPPSTSPLVTTETSVSPGTNPDSCTNHQYQFESTDLNVNQDYPEDMIACEHLPKNPNTLNSGFLASTGRNSLELVTIGVLLLVTGMTVVIRQKRKLNPVS